MHSNKTTADTLARTGIAPLLKDAGPESIAMWETLFDDSVRNNPASMLGIYALVQLFVQERFSDESMCGICRGRPP